MHLGTAALLDFHARHRDEDHLVLAVITRTEGSTYRKPGAMMLMTAGGCYQGLISGGCLEGDLLEHAAEVFETGEAKRVVYDMHSDEDLVWGLGIGCDGVIELMLVRLDRDHHQALLGGISVSLSGRKRVAFALVTASERADLPAGAIAATDEAGVRMGETALNDSLARHFPASLPNERFLHIEETGLKAVVINLEPRPRLLLCGGGPDARPLAHQAKALGWECLVADHRAAYARADRFPPDTELILCRPESVGQMVDLSQVDAAVVMSHHLQSDASYLAQLAPVALTGTLRYLGVLGPVARRNRLREMALGEKDECVDVLIHGPVGLDIGAELPEAIALAVVAEIHAVLNSRDGQSLTTGPVGRSG